MHQDQKADSGGEFEQFDEEYLTLARPNPLSPRHKSPNRSKANSKVERPKFKMVPTNDPNSDAAAFFNPKKSRKNISNASKIITIGDSLFRSNFQSGNLQSVTKTTPTTFEITLTNEMNSERMSAWFYFACEGLKGEIKFIIKGFKKTSSLYNSGMKVCYREMGENSKWKRGGNKICYTESYSEKEEEKTSYELQFTFFFTKSNNSAIEFAYSFPYTFTNLLNFISLSQIKFQSLGKSYENRDIPLLTIGNPKSKKVIILSARAHPGETVGSLMMEGFLKELISDSKYSNELREVFLFKIIPMINVDGVVNGNYRFSASGFDLNRKWKKPSEKMHPEVFLLKSFIKSMNKEKEVLMYIDFHGHSRQKNVFFYGCCPKDLTDKNGNYSTKPKEFPFLMSKLHPAFKYDYCSFDVQKEKEGTARISMWNELKIDYVYTMQGSFCGSESGGNYMIGDYEKIGGKICQGMCLHFWTTIQKERPNCPSKKRNKSKEPLKNTQDTTNVNEESEVDQMLEEMNKNMMEFFENPELAKMEFKGNSSDSEPEAGQIPVEQRKPTNKINIHKYSKPSKVLRNQKELNSQPKIYQNKSVFQEKLRVQAQRNKTNQSIRLSLVNELEQKDSHEGLLNNNPRNRKNSMMSKTQNNYYIRADIINKSINEKLKLLHKSQKIKQNGELEENGVGEFEESARLREKEENYLKSKKKAQSFEGAQYRRVRKIAEEQNRRNFSANQVAFTGNGETIIQGLIGMNNLIEIERLQPRARPPNFFPNTVGPNSRNRKTSMEMYFKRQSKVATSDTLRRIPPPTDLNIDIKSFNNSNSRPK